MSLLLPLFVFTLAAIFGVTALAATDSSFFLAVNVLSLAASHFLAVGAVDICVVTFDFVEEELEVELPDEERSNSSSVSGGVSILGCFFLDVLDIFDFDF